MSVILEVIVKSRPEMYQQLIELLLAELPVTAKAKGLIHLSCATDPETNEFRTWEIWEDAETCRNYLKWRTERGDFKRMESLTASSPGIRQMTQLEY